MLATLLRPHTAPTSHCTLPFPPPSESPRHRTRACLHAAIGLLGSVDRLAQTVTPFECTLSARDLEPHRQPAVVVEANDRRSMLTVGMKPRTTSWDPYESEWTPWQKATILTSVQDPTDNDHVSSAPLDTAAAR